MVGVSPIAPRLLLHDLERANELAQLQKRVTAYLVHVRGAKEGPTLESVDPRPLAFGSGVLVRMFGRVFVFTVGHVVKHVQEYLADGAIFLSLNGPRGHLELAAETVCLRSPGDHNGVDAGVLMLTPTQGQAIAEHGGFDPVMTSTLRPDTAEGGGPLGDEYIVSGFPAELGSDPIPTVVGKTVEVGMKMMIFIAVASRDRFDGTHLWLDASTVAIDPRSREFIKSPSFNGMSGGGCWMVEHDDELEMLKLSLIANHSGTQDDHMREVPIVHTLGLLRDHTSLRAQIDERWPGRFSDP